MNEATKENELKLDILQSLARSQRALARMIECMADWSDRSVEIGSQLRENIMVIGEYQKVLCDRLVGNELKMTRRKNGKPGPLWLNHQLNKYKESTAMNVSGTGGNPLQSVGITSVPPHKSGIHTP